MDVSCAR